ncbi:MAG: AIR synthase-related protein, partial [Myxococcota bacterium]|nr:AIR synthase-related protein [Myxococcota bacterium]
NVARAREVSLTVSAVGAVARGAVLRRGDARRGDRILVTGRLGESALARARAEREGRRIARAPEARLDAGRRLARQRFRGACIDLSDGLLADLGHVCEASGVGARVDARRVPRPRDLAAACRRLDLEPDALVLAGGDDLELLFTLPPGGPSTEALGRRLGIPVAEVGEIAARGLRVAGAAAGLAAPGWRHF